MTRLDHFRRLAARYRWLLEPRNRARQGRWELRARRAMLRRAEAEIELIHARQAEHDALTRESDE